MMRFENKRPDDDATTTTRTTKPASYAPARPVPHVRFVCDEHGGAVILDVGHVAFVSCATPRGAARQHKRVVTTAGDHDISCRVTAATTTKTYRAASEFATKLRAAVSFGAFRISIPPPPPETTRYASGSPRAGEHSAPVVAIARARPRHLFLVRPTQRAGP